MTVGYCLFNTFYIDALNFVTPCDASKWRLGTTAVVPGLPPLARDAVVPARHSLRVLSITRAPLRNPSTGSC